MMQKILLFLLSCVVFLSANEAEEIIQKVDKNMRGKNVYMQISMSIVSHGHKREMKMQTWAEGT